jgi:hypothetical protein
MSGGLWEFEAAVSVRRQKRQTTAVVSLEELLKRSLLDAAL